MLELFDTFQGKCVTKIMEVLCKDTQDREHCEILEYGLKCFIGEGIKLALLFVVFGLSGVFWEFFFAFVSLLLVRRYIGGSHRKTSTGCFMQSLLVFILIIVLGRWLVVPVEGICVNNPFVYYMIWAVLVQFVDAIMATVMEAVKEDI